MKNQDNNKCTRVKGLKKSQVDTLALGIGKISHIAVGKQKFRNGEHKGYKITSYNTVIGYSDSLQNIDNLKVLLGEKDIFGSVLKLTFIGGIEINSNDTNLILPEVLEVFASVGNTTYKSVTTTLGAEDKKELLKGARRRARKRY